MWLLVSVAEAGVDLTPVLIAVVAGLTGAGGAAFFTLRNTNRKLEAEGEKLYQEALAVADQRATTAVATMDRIRQTLEERLTATERDLQSARRQLEIYEERLRGLQLAADLAHRDRESAVLAGQRERERLQDRVTELEQQVIDLNLRVSPPGRRRRDP